jgi:hypothetical protein
MRAVEAGSGFCTACYTNRYPVEFPRREDEQLVLIEPARPRGT